MTGRKENGLQLNSLLARSVRFVAATATLRPNRSSRRLLQLFSILACTCIPPRKRINERALAGRRARAAYVVPLPHRIDIQTFLMPQKFRRIRILGKLDHYIAV